MTTTCTTTCNEIHRGDIGTIFEVTIYDCDILVPSMDLLVSKELVFKKPDGVVVTQTAEFKTDGTDSIIQYTSVADDLDQAGKWSIQAKLEFPSGTWRSTIDKFKVFENLE